MLCFHLEMLDIPMKAVKLYSNIMRVYATEQRC